MLQTNKIYNMDCLKGLKQLEDNSVDLIITDPPYGSSGRDGSVHLEKDNIFGNRMSSDSLVWFVRAYSKELFRISKSDIHCYIFSDWRKYKDIQIAFETSGWELRSLIVWDKGNGMGEFWRSSHEFILFFTKLKPKKLSHGGCMNVLKFKPPRGKEKIIYSQKSTEMIKYLIEASSKEGDLVLDCFMGSGTTAVACNELGRDYIGFEINQDYISMSNKRLEQQTLKVSDKV